MSREPLTPVQRTVLLTVIATNLATSFLGSSMNLSTPAIGDEFGVGATTLTWVVSAFTLTIAMLTLPAGSFADAIGRRRVFLAGLSVFVATTLLGGIAPTFAILLAARVGQACGGAMIQAANVPIAISAFPPQRRGWVLGWTVSAVYVGLGMGPVLGGAINQFLGWRFIFLIAMIASGAVLLLASRRIPDDALGKFRITDPLGVVLFMSGVFCLVFGLSNTADYTWSWAVAAGGLALLAVFCIHETRTGAPLLDMGLFKHNRVFVFSNLAALMNYSATFAISYTMSLYLQSVQGLPSAAAGLVLVCQPVVQALVSPVCGRLSDRVPPTWLASAGMALSALGLFLLSCLGTSSPLSAVMGPLVLVGLGFGLFSSPNNNAALSRVEPAQFGRANAIIGTMRSLGMSLSLAVLTVIFAAHLGDTLVTQADPQALTQTISFALRIASGVCCVGIVFSAVRGT